jgi:hypothetical protein
MSSFINVSDSAESLNIFPVRHLIEGLPPAQARVVAVCIKPSNDILLTTVNLIVPNYLADLFSSFSKDDITTAQKILPITIMYAVSACSCYEYQYKIPAGLSVADSISLFTTRLESNTKLVVETILQSLKINSPKGGDYFYTKETFTRNVLQPLLQDNMAKNPTPQANVGLSPYQMGQLNADAADAVMDNFYTIIAPNLPDVEIIPYFIKNMNNYFLPKATEYFLKFAPIFLNYSPSTYNPIYPPTNDLLLNKYLSMDQAVYSPGEKMNVDIFTEIVLNP